LFFEKFNFFNFKIEYSLNLLLFNIFVYILLLCLIFSIIFIFNTKFFKSLNDLSNINFFGFFSFVLFTTILSMAGVPPMLGFISKFLIFFYFIFKFNYFLVFIFSLFNFFVIYFYIQNLRFMITKKLTNFFFFKNNFVFLDFNLVFIINNLIFFNFFGIFVVEDILL
jgi:NADH:ubiquinone oxidoreductase subunit 2 (subunit N)